MKEEPKKKLVLKIKEGSITPEHFNKREVENYLLTVVDSIEDTGMLPEDKAKLDALPTASELQNTLNGKQNSLTFDSAPTENSANPVYSSGIKSYVDNHIPTTDATPTQGSNNPVSSNGVKTALDTLDEKINAIIGGNATLNLSVSPASIFANTSASVTVTATASMQATSINIKKGGTTVQSGSNTTSINYTETVILNSGETITYSAEGVINGVTKTVSNKTVRAYDKIYYGVGTENSYSGITTYQSIRTSAAGTYSFNTTSEKQYVYVLVPYAMTAINLNNVKLDSGFGYNLQLISDNATIDDARYRVYRSAANAAGESFNVVIS